MKQYRYYSKYIRPGSILQLSNFVIQKYFPSKNTYIKYHPLSLTFYVTDRCTLNCKMCLQHSFDRNLDPSLNNCYHQECKDMTIETFNYALSLFNKSLFVGLAGVGEPFLNTNLIHMIKLSSINNKIVGVISNGTVLNDKIDSIIESSLDHISLSLNAINKDDYIDISCCEGYLFDTVVDNINCLVKQRNRKKSKLRIDVSFVCHKGNYQKIPEMIEFSEGLGVDRVSLINLIPTMKNEFKRDKCLYADNNDVVDLITNIKIKKYKLDVKWPTLFVPCCENRICRWYFQNVSIDSDGNIGSCGAIMPPNPEYGNIFKDREPWNNSHFINMRKMFSSRALPLSEICKYCANNL